MFEEGLVAFLAADSRVVAQLGTPSQRSDKKTGIFPLLAPSELPVPYLVYQKIDGNPMTIAFEGTNALSRAKYKLAAFGSTYKQAKQLAKAVHDACLEIDGTFGGNVEVHGAWCTDDGQDNAETMTNGTLYSTHLEFEFNYLDTSVT